MKFCITYVPCGPVPTQPTTIRSLAGTAPDPPRAVERTKYGNPTAPNATPVVLLRKLRRVTFPCRTIVVLLTNLNSVIGTDLLTPRV